MPVLWLIAATNTSAEILACEEAGITVTLTKPYDLELKAGRAAHEGRANHQQHQHAPGAALAAPMRLSNDAFAALHESGFGPTATSRGDTLESALWGKPEEIYSL
jgi:hypothetical protein